MYDRFKALLDQAPARHRHNEQIKGTVISADRRGAYIDIGGKAAAFCSIDNFTTVAISDVRSRRARVAPGRA